MATRKTLLLGQNEVRKLINIKQAISAVEEAFGEYGRGRARMPAKIYLNLPKFRGDFRAMPAYVDKFKLATLKWVNAHPLNPTRGLPAVMAVIIVSDPKTGFPLCIMDGTLATSLRTGAGGAVAAKYLARARSSVVGLVGCGAQARTQLAALREIFSLKEIRVWGHEKKLIARFIHDMKKPGEQMIAAVSIKECVGGCDIVVTTTPSRVPIVKSAWISPGTHINAIGADAPGKEELDPQLLKRARVVVDDYNQASHSGEINVPVAKGIFKIKNIHATLGEVVAGKKRGRTSNAQITIFDSTGLAIQDVAVAGLVYRAALKNKTGRPISLIS